MNIDQFIKEAQARCDAATVGPWKRHVYQSGSVSVSTSGKQWFDVCHAKQMVPDEALNWTDDKSTGAEIERLSNADFISNARQDLPAALEIIAALRARVAELERDRSEVNGLLMRELTPGGPEFYNDPGACIKFAKTRMQSFSMSKVAELKQDLATLRARVAELEAALERIADFEFELYDDHIRLSQGDPEQFTAALEAVRGPK